MFLSTTLLKVYSRALEEDYIEITISFWIPKSHSLKKKKFVIRDFGVDVFLGIHNQVVQDNLSYSPCQKLSDPMSNSFN